MAPARTSWRGFAAGVTAAALLATPAAAQRAGGDDRPFGASGITSVAVPAKRGYRLEAGVRVLYDDNLLRVPDDAPPLQGRAKADTRISPFVSAGYSMPVGRQQLFIGGLVGRDFYAKNTELNRNRYEIGGGLNWRAGSSCTGTLAGEYRRRQNLLTEQTSPTDPTGRRIPNVQEIYNYGGTANCQAPVGIGFGGSIIRNETNNLNPQRRSFNSRSTVFAPNVSYGSPVIGRFSIGGSYNKVDYPERFVRQPDLTLVGDKVDIYSGRFGYQRSLGTRLSATLGVSYNRVNPKPRTTVLLIPVIIPPDPNPRLAVVAQDRPSHSGAGFDAAISYTPSPRLSAQFNASRDVSSTANVGALYVINTSFGADLSYSLGPAITTGIGATFFKRDYRGGFASPTEPTLRISDKTSRVYARVGYSPVKLYDIDLEVAHQKRDSNPAVFSFSGNSISLNLRIKFGRS